MARDKTATNHAMLAGCGGAMTSLRARAMAKSVSTLGGADRRIGGAICGAALLLGYSQHKPFLLFSSHDAVDSVDECDNDNGAPSTAAARAASSCARSTLQAAQRRQIPSGVSA